MFWLCKTVGVYSACKARFLVGPPIEEIKRPVGVLFLLFLVRSSLLAPLAELFEFDLALDELLVFT